MHTTLAAVLTLALAGPLPAPPAVEMSLADSTLAGTRTVTAGPVLSAAAPVPLRDPVVTFDLGGLAGVARATGDRSCVAATPARLVCTPPWPLTPGPLPFSGAARIELTADPGARPGATGRLTVTLTARGMQPVSRTARVRVAEPVGLTAGAAPRAQAAPGTPFELSPTVRNTGTRAVRGVWVSVLDEWALQPRERFRNCRYASGLLLSCRFGQTLRPGVTYRLTLPYRLRADSRAPASFWGAHRWLTPADAEDRRLDRTGAPGAGGTLRLTAARSLPQADPDTYDDNEFGEVIATGRQGFDLVALGGTASVRGVTVGVRNAGPATTDGIRAGENVARLDVVLPAGVVVTEVPAGCRVRTAGRYWCSSSYFLRAGAAETFHFGLRAGRARPGATGRVVVYGMGRGDLDPATDRATLTWR